MEKTERMLQLTAKIIEKLENIIPEKLRSNLLKFELENGQHLLLEQTSIKGLDNEEALKQFAVNDYVYNLQLYHNGKYINCTEEVKANILAGVYNKNTIEYTIEEAFEDAVGDEVDYIEEKVVINDEEIIEEVDELEDGGIIGTL